MRHSISMRLEHWHYETFRTRSEDPALAAEEEGVRPLKVARVSAGFIGVEDGIHPSHIWTLVPRVGAAPAP